MSRRRLGLAAAAGAAVLATGPHVSAQPYQPLTALPTTGTASTLPSIGTTVNLGNQRAFLEQLVNGGGSAVGKPGWAVSFEGDLQEQITDSAAASNGKTGPDLITQITPSVAVNGESERLKANVFYAPQLWFYAADPNQSSVGQNLNGSALLTAVPQTLFLDLRGFASTQATFGGQGPNGVTAINRQNLTQSSALSASPYATHRFGDLGTAELGYTVATSASNQLASVSSFDPNVVQPGNNNLTSQTEHFAFLSGEALGRINSSTLVTASQLDGTGVLANAHNNLAIEDIGYAVTRTITLLGRGGYEDIKYSGTPQTNIKDTVWAGGVRLTPNQDSSVTVRYGHQDGFNSAFLDASYSPTARTRIFANYSESLTTYQQQLQDAVTSSDVDPFGNSIDRDTGAPILPVTNFFGVQQGLYHLKSYSITGIYLLPRDSISATLSSEQRILVATAPGELGQGSTRGTYGTLSWSHDLTPRAQTNAFLQYGSSNTFAVAEGSQGNQQTFVAAGTVTYDFSETLRGTAQYSISKALANQQGSNTIQNLLLVGLHKRF